jgi:hypothetical protein
MVRFALGIVLLVSAGPLATCQSIPSQQPPMIHLALPPGIPPETAQINYFMTGPFGGYGSFVRTEKGQSTYNIVASVDGKAAVSVKLIVYFPGCELKAFDIPVHNSTVSQQLLCTPLAQIALHGQIAPASIVQQPSEVEITYLAIWDHKFFGIADGTVTAIRGAAGAPDQNGHFEVTVPDFHAQADLGEAEFQFTLREIKSGNIIAILNPADDALGSGALKVRASYAQLIRFSAGRMH